jgi:3-methyladenine DNA glycosylase AlkC
VAEPLKNQFGPEVPTAIAAAITQVHPAFDGDGFLAACLDGYEALELTPRARHISDRLAVFLPTDRTASMEIIIETLDELAVAGDDAALGGMASFRYLPYVYFVADHGLGDFETAMRAQYELTKRFTAEFSIRAFLVHHRDATLDRLREWTTDDDENVRRLVSEGTRPRLPWAPRLAEFQADPAPVLELLERLRHDRSEYVRRSVANNVNDIAKDHPDVVVDTCRRWSADIDPDRDGPEQASRETWMIRHALRTLVKQGDPDALDVLGFGLSSPARVTRWSIDPTQVAIGDKVRVTISIENPSADPSRALVDLRIHFVKSNGSTSPKVFKGGELDLEPRSSATVRRTISLAQHSTRTHHLGTHAVDALLNGVVVPLGTFELTR